MTLAGFDPLVADWFERRVGAPTAIQRLAWPRVAAGEHLLFTAPTGSGKTLAGFLWPLERLLTGAWSAGGTRVVYVSPLKALNTDIERNLRAPLAELTAAFEAAGRQPPAIRVGVRSGDTPPAERARMLRRPPEILVTTPESLNLMLLSTKAPALFAGVRLVLLDEIHALYGTKRGVHLVTAVERLQRLAGEFQRVAISATVRPIEEVARFVGGFRLDDPAARARGVEPTFTRRPVAVVAAPAEKRYELGVRFPFDPEAPVEQRAGDAFWRTVATDLAARIGEVRSTIVFTNSRRMAEKLTRFVNEAAGSELAWSHHGSLSREIRSAVETRLKEGRLPAIVATSSLELGIDVGALDRVVLLQSPRSFASALQRIGRSGHRAGETSRALFYPTHARDLVDAAVTTVAVLAGEIEPLRPLRAPLDLLAQLVLSITARERWRIDDLYDFVRTSEPYRELSRRQFDLVIEMLAGRYAEGRLEELRPRVVIDRIDGTIVGRAGVASLLARAGGTIPDRGYFQLRLADSRALLGELDEEFVWERSIGDTFTLGAQSWRVQSIGANEVLVAPARGGASLAPFWKADARDRNAYVSERVGRFLEVAERRLADPEFETSLVTEHAFEPAAARELVRVLAAERTATGVALPHGRHLVIEECVEPGSPDDGSPGGAARRQHVLFTFWGGSVNRPLSLALAALAEERGLGRIEVESDDDALLVVAPAGLDLRALLLALEPERIEELLRHRLEGSGLFGALFRQNAQRALLLPRALPGRRTPLWLQRQAAKRLLDAVEPFDDFPILVETWRSCLADEFELEVLRERLAQMASGAIAVDRVELAHPSPFAAALVWRRTNDLMYQDDVADARRSPRVAADLVREIALAGELRPTVSRELAERYRVTAQRLLPGYLPADAEELLEWLRERLWIPTDEWRELLAAIDAEAQRQAASRGDAPPDPPPSEAWSAAIAAKMVRRWGGTTAEAIAAAETALDEGDPTAFARALAFWLRFEPPLPRGELERRCGVAPEILRAALDELVRTGRAVTGELVAGAGADQVAALSVSETLLRFRRREARSDLRPLPLARLPLWLARRQCLAGAATGVDALARALEPLLGFPAPAALWERELIPARVGDATPAALDALLAESDLRWIGVGHGRATFAFLGDLDLFPAEPPERATEERGDEAVELERRIWHELAAARAGLATGELALAVDAPTSAVVRALWNLAWRGRVTSDSFRALRSGIASDFEPSEREPERGATPRAGGRGALRRWSSGRPLAERWLALPEIDPGDPLAREERSRERVRRLAARYGVLFRELLAQELPELAWRSVARSIRALELGGELVAGQFFEGVPGPQFAPPAAVAELAGGVDGSPLFWCGATDPASLCGIDLPELRGALPQRRIGTWLVYRGETLAAIARRGGRELELRTSAADPALAELVVPYRVALTRPVDPERAIELETINGEPAASSALLAAFDGFDRTRESGGRVRLRRSYRI